MIIFTIKNNIIKIMKIIIMPVICVRRRWYWMEVTGGEWRSLGKNICFYSDPWTDMVSLIIMRMMMVLMVKMMIIITSSPS